MEDLIEVVKKWRGMAFKKKKKAVTIGDSHESNYQLGKIKICNEFITFLENEIKQEKETSKTGDKQSVQSTKDDH